MDILFGYVLKIIVELLDRFWIFNNKINDRKLMSNVR
jgi:hypothetical protein